MRHQFTHPVRVVEIGRRETDEDEQEPDGFLPPVPPATDDGTPVTGVRREPPEPR